MGDTTAETQLIAPSVWSNSTLCKPYGTRMHRTYGRAPRTRQSTLHATKATRAKKTYTALLPCCLKPGSNQRPSDLQSDALPTELLRLVVAAMLLWVINSGLQCPWYTMGALIRFGSLLRALVLAAADHVAKSSPSELRPHVGVKKV